MSNKYLFILDAVCIILWIIFVKSLDKIAGNIWYEHVLQMGGTWADNDFDLDEIRDD